MIRIFTICFLLLSFIFLGKSGFSQVSQGGIPLEIVELKSAVDYTIEMPGITEMDIKKAEIVRESSTNKLKPFRFAYSFDVDFNTSNSGKWFSAENGYACWRLKIRSVGAKSLNIIFSDFSLPPKARLFIYNDNQILGAFTDFNNKSSRKFAVAPIAGDEIIVQYEVPEKIKSNQSFVIKSVNHDYIGILKSDDRRPLRKVAGSCNIDINCDEGDDWSDVKNSVCRLIVNGVEVCSGALVNNTAQDQKPYILSAAHCYDRWNLAETTVYVFNYESPFCAPLDGDPIHSVSGAVMKAQFDSLDFALAELSLIPPPEYRPYYAGWNKEKGLPGSSASIHHPQGDIKKIAIDNDSPVIARFSNQYVKDAFFKILRWDAGVTEAGSSGGPLFNPAKQIIGTLTGGEAECDNPVNDYFERIALAWDYKSDSSRQLKCWLDPLGEGVLSMDGKQFNSGESLCAAYTNLTDIDSYDNISITSEGKFSGYWGGSNNVGITEIMERFSILGNEQLSGISFGVAKVNAAGANNNSEITVKVYNGNSKPEQLIYSQIVRIKNLVPDAMNFLGFDEIVEPADTFFIGFELSNVQSPDSFAVYQSIRAAYEDNSFYLKKENEWLRFNDINQNGKSMVNVFELVACNIDNFTSDTPLVNNPLEIILYPNPVKSTFILEAGREINENGISVYNMIGQEIKFQETRISTRKAEIDLNGNIPGVYLVRYRNLKGGSIAKKISYVPW